MFEFSAPIWFNNSLLTISQQKVECLPRAMIIKSRSQICAVGGNPVTWVLAAIPVTIKSSWQNAASKAFLTHYGSSRYLAQHTNHSASVRAQLSRGLIHSDYIWPSEKTIIISCYVSPFSRMKGWWGTSLVWTHLGKVDLQKELFERKSRCALTQFHRFLKTLNFYVIQGVFGVNSGMQNMQQS